MSAQPIDPDHETAHGTLVPMRLLDVPEVASIERAVYAAPWTEGNFVDSLNAGYCAWVFRAHGAPRPVIGYFVLMAAVDEAHLLNLSIAGDLQHRGHGLFLLRKAVALTIEYNASSLILEVRPSNTRALAVYRRFGFREFGVRKRYYPGSLEDPQAREDAIVMRLAL